MEEPGIVAVLRAAGCVYAEEEAALLAGATTDPATLAALVARRTAGEPLEQVLGWAEFLGLRLRVLPGVFVPRRRSELLAMTAIGLLRAGAIAVELCCGAGPLAAAIRARVPGVQVYAADASPAAVGCARTNLPPDTVFEGDLFAALPDSLRSRVDVLVVNPPYVPTGEIALLPAEARDHEPLDTLDGGPDGLAPLRRISASAPQWLAPGGHLLVEVGEQQLPPALQMLAGDGLAGSAVREESLGATVAIGSMPATPRRWSAPRTPPGRHGRSR